VRLSWQLWMLAALGAVPTKASGLAPAAPPAGSAAAPAAAAVAKPGGKRSRWDATPAMVAGGATPAYGAGGMGAPPA